MGRFDTGWWDSLFGERVTLEVPGRNGTVVKRSVTRKWLDQMTEQEKMTEVDVVQVHMLDPGRGYHTLVWRVGEDVPRETVEKLRDPGTDAIYAMAWYEQGIRKTAVVRKDKWDDLRQQFATIDHPDGAS